VSGPLGRSFVAFVGLPLLLPPSSFLPLPLLVVVGLEAAVHSSGSNSGSLACSVILAAYSAADSTMMWVRGMARSLGTEGGNGAYLGCVVVADVGTSGGSNTS
jgi:hypothetical protein